MPLSGAETAAALLQFGDLSPLRLQKAARHLTTDQQQRDFVEAIPPLQRAQIVNGMRLYLPSLPA